MKTIKNWRAALLVATAMVLASSSGAFANKLVFNFLHPTFGGNPNLTTHLFGLATAQNQFGSSSTGGSSTPNFDFGSGGIGNGPVIIINAGDPDIAGPNVGIGGN